MTLLELYKSGKEVLRAAQIEEWELDAWYLLEHVTSCTRNDLFLHSDRRVENSEETRYHELLRKRCSRIPLQYLTGSQEFMGYSFYVNEQVLIPRQDTETLVEEAVKYIHPGMEILDLCTGSGCILLSILKLVQNVKGTGADVSGPAIQVAEQNRICLGVRAELLQSDLFDQIKGTYDCIISNPPYIPSRVIDTLMEEVREYEPRLALDGREDGLYYYREITEQSPAHLKPGGRLFLEIGYDQADAVTELMEKSFTDISVKKDLSGHDRVVYGSLKT